MKQTHRPIDTGVGELQGRTGIALDSFYFNMGTLSLELEGGFLPTHATSSADEVGFKLIFAGLLAFQMIELDTWESMLTSEDAGISSFDEVLNSEWLARMGGKASPKHKHYRLITYDYVIDVICQWFELTTDKPSES